MGTQVTPTGITFNDGTSQTTAAVSSYVGGRGQTFTASGTFTIPSGITAIKVTVTAGGANGGAGPAGYSSGGGGGAGGTAIKYLTGLTPGNTLAVTVGGVAASSSVASGTQSISTISATGGSAGSGTSTGIGDQGVQGGAGGSASGGDMNLNGQAGSPGVADSNSHTIYGSGGSSFYGGGGRGPGGAASCFGAGGGGGASNSPGAGSAGVVVFEW